MKRYTPGLLAILLLVSWIFIVVLIFAPADIDAQVQTTVDPVTATFQVRNTNLFNGAGLPQRAALVATEVVIGDVIRGSAGDRIVCYPGVTDCPPLQSFLPTATATPLILPSFTPPPSATVTVILSSTTPPPTNTPRPSATAVPTDIPPATPIIDSTPTPEEGFCVGKVAAGPLNVRDEPAGSTILGQLAEGDPLRLLGRTASKDGRLWYQIWWQPERVGYAYAGLITLDPTTNCHFDTAWGLWVGPGAPRDELLRFGETLRAAGIQPAATVYGEPETANLLYDDGWVVIFRPWIGNCPDNTAPAEVSARVWWAAIQQAIVGVRFTWLSASNECGWPSADYLRAWIMELDRLAHDAGIKHLVPTVFSSGAPDLTWLPVLYPAYQQVQAHGGAFGLNQYPVPQALGMTDLPLGEVNAWTIYTTYRYMMMIPKLPPGLPVIVTEAARSGGEQPPNWEDVTKYVGIVDGSITAVTLWYDAIPLLPWEQATIRGQESRAAQAIVAASKQ